MGIPLIQQVEGRLSIRVVGLGTIGKQQLLQMLVPVRTELVSVFSKHALKPEEVGHGHVTAYVIMELYGFSMMAYTEVVWTSFGKVLLLKLAAATEWFQCNCTVAVATLL